MVSIKTVIFFLLLGFVVLGQIGSVGTKEYGIERMIFWSSWLIVMTLYYFLVMY